MMDEHQALLIVKTCGRYSENRSISVAKKKSMPVMPIYSETSLSMDDDAEHLTLRKSSRE